MKNLIFLLKPFRSMTKKSRQKLKYLENEKTFWGDIKSIFHHFQRAFNCQKLSQAWQCTFKWMINFGCSKFKRICNFGSGHKCMLTGWETISDMIPWWVNTLVYYLFIIALPLPVNFCSLFSNLLYPPSKCTFSMNPLC